MPRVVREVQRVRDEHGRFVHYTSADSGLKILRTERILLRNSTLMNDFSEVQYGMDCLAAAYNGPEGDRLKAAMKTVQADLPEILEGNFNSQLFDVRQETYLLAISEHGDALEDHFGRLSMWRAYAPENGVAFIFRNAPFLSESAALQAYSIPVSYATPDTFANEFKELVDSIEANIEIITPLGGQFMHDMLVSTFRYAVQSTKHPAFREEREWRVIYTPTLITQDQKQLDRIPTEIMCLGGVPQRVYAIPFKDYPDENFTGATIPQLLERILIGPTQDAYAIREAFVAELKRLGVDEPQVFATGIPLRH